MEEEFGEDYYVACIYLWEQFKRIYEAVVDVEKKDPVEEDPKETLI